MNFVSIIVVIFSVLAAIDRIFGSRLGLGKEFERGFMLFGNMALSMIGMIIISPWIADMLSPAFDGFYSIFGIDPSIIPASLFANDMGGAPLSVEVAKDASLGLYNALVVSSMMGVTISFTIPYALGAVKKDNHREMFLGLLCGIVTVPVGCFVSGLMLGIGLLDVILNLTPIIIIAIVIALGLLFAPNMSVKIFSILGIAMKVIITVGLALGIIRFLTGVEVIKGLATIEEGAAVCLNAAIVMTGAFPLIYIISRLLKRPIQSVGRAAQINEVSAVGFVSTLATSVTTFGMMDDMDKKGILLNSAFAVSAAFTFAGHMAFTMAFPGSDGAYIGAMIAGKLISGVFALALAVIIHKRQTPKAQNEAVQVIENT
jgi:ethanolamine transporter